MMYTSGSYSYRVSAGSFFQTNRFLAPKLVELVTGNRSGRAALDFLPEWDCLRCRCRAILSALLRLKLRRTRMTIWRPTLRFRTFRRCTARREDYLNAARGRWDFAVVDPPRAGLGERAAKALAGLSIPRLDLRLLRSGDALARSGDVAGGWISRGRSASGGSVSADLSHGNHSPSDS